MDTIAILVLTLMFIGVLPTWPYSANWGYYLSAGVGLILLMLVVLTLAGRRGRPAY